MRTFPIPDEPLSIEEIDARLDSQTNAATWIAGKLQQAVDTRLQSQDAVLSAQTKKLRNSVTGRIRAQQNMLVPIVGPLVDAVDLAIAQQGSLIGALPPEAIDHALAHPAGEIAHNFAALHPPIAPSQGSQYVSPSASPITSYAPLGQHFTINPLWGCPPNVPFDVYMLPPSESPGGETPTYFMPHPSSPSYPESLWYGTFPDLATFAADVDTRGAAMGLFAPGLAQMDCSAPGKPPPMPPVPPNVPPNAPPPAIPPIAPPNGPAPVAPPIWAQPIVGPDGCCTVNVTVQVPPPTIIGRLGGGAQSPPPRIGVMAGGEERPAEDIFFARGDPGGGGGDWGPGLPDRPAEDIFFAREDPGGGGGDWGVPGAPDPARGIGPGGDIDADWLAYLDLTEVAKAKLPYWGDLAVCAGIEAFNAKSKLTGLADLPKWLTWLTDTEGYAAHTAALSLLKGQSDWIKYPLSELLGKIGGLVAWAFQGKAYDEDCNHLANLAPRVMQTAMDWFAKFVPLQNQAARQSLTYWTQYNCPTRLPGIGEANSAYLNGEIRDEVWRCWIRANGGLEEPARRIRESQRTKPGISGIIDGLRKGYITEPGDYHTRVASAGVTRGDDRQLLEKLANYWPGVGDIIQFMTRDVFDPAVVAKLGLDTEFTIKYTDEAERIGTGAGLDRETARLFWRAHWQPVGQGQAIDALHRLRPGRVPQDLQVTENDVAEILAINDVLPSWRKRIMALSYRMPDKREVKAGYYDGVFSDSETIELLKDTGYDQRGADVVLRTWGPARVNHWMASHWGQAYQHGGISGADLARKMVSLGMNESVAISIVGEINQLLSARSQIACVEALKKRYDTGYYTEGELEGELKNAGLDDMQALSMSKAWTCQLASKEKTIGAAELCVWASSGLITSAEYITRLVRLGYDPMDANRVAKICSNKLLAAQNKARQLSIAKQARIAEKAAKAKAQAAKAVAMAEAKAKSATEKAQRQATATAARQEKARLASLAKSQTARDKLLIQSEKYADKAAAITGNDVLTESANVRRYLDMLRSKYGMDTPTASATIAEALRAAKADKASTWEDYVERIAAGSK